MNDQDLLDEMERVTGVRDRHVRNLNTWATQDEVDDLNRYLEVMAEELGQRMADKLQVAMS